MIDGPLTRTSQRMSASGTSLTVTPGKGTPTMPAPRAGTCCNNAPGAVSVSPHDEVISGTRRPVWAASVSNPAHVSCGRDAPA